MLLKRHALPTQDRLLEVFDYDEETGKLLWKRRSLKEFPSANSAKSWNTKYSGKVAGCSDKNGAIVIRLCGNMEFAHRLIWKMKTGEEPSHLDHKDLNNSNNQFNNLRPTSDSANACNVRGHKNTISGLKGVGFDKNLKNKPWFATTTKNRKSYYGGHFATKEEAFASACTLRMKLHGDFVRHGED